MSKRNAVVLSPEDEQLILESLHFLAAIGDAFFLMGIASKDLEPLPTTLQTFGDIIVNQVKALSSALGVSL